MCGNEKYLTKKAKNLCTGLYGPHGFRNLDMLHLNRVLSKAMRILQLGHVHC